ncbi:terminase small subunit [Lactococcus petauri]|uniref:Terminase small subunit n=1 Tax=Lactococcus petauri TaxID=1940789 RepID=A0AAJ2MKK3_9LACT|nr:MULTISPECIES: terminase small subunit [Lactococcus]MBS4463494.1 terminase small subunit [Lactococcus garvieae]MDT2584177.1 terminase small subunit [Lactococcus petauri]
MTIKQKKFADYYIETGNATQSAIRAGYSKKTANRIATENLSKLVISEYIQKRLKELEKSRLMTVEEALLLSKSIANGEPQTFIYRELDPKTDEVLVEEKKQYSPKIEERQKSIEHILKVNGAFDKKEAATNQDDELKRLADSLENLK